MLDSVDIVCRHLKIGTRHVQAEPKFSAPLPLAKRFFGKPKRKRTKTAKDPAHKSPKKAKSRKERAAEAVKDLVDASTVEFFFGWND